MSQKMGSEDADNYEDVDVVDIVKDVLKLPTMRKTLMFTKPTLTR